MIFDEDHDFEGPRAPKAHLDTVLTKPVVPPEHPLYGVCRRARRETCSLGDQLERADAGSWQISDCYAITS